ncbi:MAG: transposase, partial [Verrucomicrobia bacterium]|nr:transposase [Verrucomicrobiota bacterium]
MEDRYRALVLDGVYLSVKKAQGADDRPLLVAYGIDENLRREVIDFRLAPSESQGRRISFLNLRRFLAHGVCGGPWGHLIV